MFDIGLIYILVGFSLPVINDFSYLRYKLIWKSKLESFDLEFQCECKRCCCFEYEFYNVWLVIICKLVTWSNFRFVEGPENWEKGQWLITNRDLTVLH